MFKDKKIKDEIKRQTLPDKSFETFCDEHGIDLNTQPKAPQRRTKKFGFRVGVAASFVVTLVITLSVMIPMSFGNKPETPAAPVNPGIIEPVAPPVTPEPKRYSADEVKGTKIDLDTLYADSEIYLFDFDNVEIYNYINEMTPLDGTNILLAYMVSSAVYGFYIEDELYVYEFDYFIRCYEYYDFIGADIFVNLINEVNVNSVSYKYKIEDSAFISFRKGNYEYFIELRDFEDTTPINQTTVELFINNVL